MSFETADFVVLPRSRRCSLMSLDRARAARHCCRALRDRTQSDERYARVSLPRSMLVLLVRESDAVGAARSQSQMRTLSIPAVSTKNAFEFSPSLSFLTFSRTFEAARAYLLFDDLECP